MFAMIVQILEIEANRNEFKLQDTGLDYPDKFYMSDVVIDSTNGY